MNYHDERPNPDVLLKNIRTNEPKKVGKLKIFFGYAAGVGKTYAMLDDAQEQLKNGVNVLVGYVEPHTRSETMQLLEGLPVLPPMVVNHRNIQLREFDLDSALEKKPELILVDELAHSNADGLRNKKRYQDIEELLNAGIYSLVSSTMFSRPLVVRSFLLISYNTPVRCSLSTDKRACVLIRTVNALVMNATKNIMTKVTG